MKNEHLKFTYGPIAKKNRRWLGIKQKELAELLNISQSTTSSIESGRYNPSYAAFMKLKEVCHFSLENEPLWIPRAISLAIQNDKPIVSFAGLETTFVPFFGAARTSFENLFIYNEMIYEIIDENTPLKYGNEYLVYNKLTQSFFEAKPILYFDNNTSLESVLLLDGVKATNLNNSYLIIAKKGISNL